MKLEFIKPDKLDPATKLTGLDYVDVPGNSSVDYKLNFYAFKETQYQLKVCLLSSVHDAVPVRVHVHDVYMSVNK